MYAHTNNGPYDSAKQFIETFLEPHSYSNKYAFTYAIIDTSNPASTEDPDGDLAGMISYTRADDESFSVEIGFVQTAPAYQRRGIATTAAALLVKYALDVPANEPCTTQGLALCRVEWCCSTRNTASIRTAERLGFTKFATINYDRVLEKGEARGKIGNGKAKPPRSRPDDLWRDLALYSITWDEWQDGVRDRVLKYLAES